MIVLYFVRFFLAIAVWYTWIGYFDHRNPFKGSDNELLYNLLFMMAPAAVFLLLGILGTLRLPKWLPLSQRPLIFLAKNASYLIVGTAVLSAIAYYSFTYQIGVILTAVLLLFGVVAIGFLGFVQLVGLLVLTIAGSMRAGRLRKMERKKPLVGPVDIMGFNTPWATGIAFASDGTVRMLSDDLVEDYKRSDISQAHWQLLGNVPGEVTVWFGPKRRSFRSMDPEADAAMLLHLAAGRA